MNVPWFIKAAARSVGGSVGSAVSRSGLLCSSRTSRKMSSRQADHLERTASNYRQEGLFSARVCGITDESRKVRRLQLEVPHPDFSFRAGQWVDFYIPGMEKVGGFSVCSSPGLLQRTGVIELAVKYTEHPPAHWIHTKCTVDSGVELRVGGDFFFDPRPSDPTVDLLLVAGGVGINPLYSILLHTADLLRQPSGYRPGHAHLCYSAKNTEELLFKNSIIGVLHEFPDKISCNFHVTQQGCEVEPYLQPHTTSGRISEEELRRYVDPVRTLCYLCGPPPMIESVSTVLQRLGLPQNRILFEKWW
ncbi:oxidoreductase NAD-binding domain-containing protein 1 [Astyanax mexicanus]|uniref:Oxidoreductase NAD-binding domain-containing protein 1 n=3 Tax=Astyanax mexicanus TaxID=7994 RepID=W5KIZ6_ASTMX|nr:oxidoreductase NAD-binding domain-containing protein 1 [Astyanax mexicanus]XP_022521038.1 oxidoreductase NAD-binding domain-containing protein 1 [Astyanax mexicanus]KAG9280040.1 oxidoreductase NAD-binding domain-containing protein 1 [Astyanax mexicanus]